MPLMIGENLIKVTASGAGWDPGTESITITRVPGIVGNLKAASGKQQVTLSWDPVPDAASYNIYWSTSRDVSKATGTMIAGVNSPYTQTGLADGDTYYYIVTAVVFGVEGESSSVVAATPGWVAESVAELPLMDQILDSSIATDSASKAHLHYLSLDQTGTTDIIRSYYVMNVTGAWTPLLVRQDSGSYSGYYPPSADIALDSQNTVHVSVLDFNSLYHAIYASGTWKPDSLGTATCGGSLAVDSAGKAHIGYIGGSSQDELRYATNTSGSWTSSVAGGAARGCPGGSTSLGVDAAGAAHIAYRGIDNSLKYATNQGGGWTVSVVDQGCCVVRVSLAVDPSGGVHIVYANYTTGQLKYAQNVSGTWTIETIDSEDTYYNSLSVPSLGLDAAGKAHVSYYSCHVSNSSCDYGELRYASNSSGTWHLAAIESVVPVYDTDIALDSQGKAHISYTTNKGLRYATNK
ncbi:MAG: fibronectin type III domain-containing protein [Nitrospira sp.]|nr:fibronectin type III domain-containing protein [Nitrospira sp.]